MTEQTRLSDTAVLHRALELLRLALVQVEDYSENEWVMDNVTGQSASTAEIREFLLRHGMPAMDDKRRNYIQGHGGLMSAFNDLYDMADDRGDV